MDISCIVQVLPSLIDDKLLCASTLVKYFQTVSKYYVYCIQYQLRRFYLGEFITLSDEKKCLFCRAVLPECIETTTVAQWVYARLISERPQMQVNFLTEVKLSRAT